MSKLRVFSSYAARRRKYKVFMEDRCGENNANGVDHHHYLIKLQMIGKVKDSRKAWVRAYVIPFTEM